jgi:hypothetical protein
MHPQITQITPIGRKPFGSPAAMRPADGAAFAAPAERLRPRDTPESVQSA